MCLFGRLIRDFIPIHPGKYQNHKTWQETLASHEEALHNQHMRDAERLSANIRIIPPLTIGDWIRIQNLKGPHFTKWDKTGIVRQFHQYVVRVDGSGRLTLRNRKFLRKSLPVITRAPLTMALKQEVSMLTQVTKSPHGQIQTPTRPPQPDDQNLTKPSPWKSPCRSRTFP
ncbi:transcription factor iiib 90 kda subunit [Plakobranchus ocellatus]|uniref:Transcription factor iiib 90 kDa subunit n=1 Tax=Plakobranchus ocellatus TaxID=259542 RepID=A0AAV4D8R3_9GAST|nr:transcription factor iiib 90 kda subunit [Plakobranchus ocellatus]